MADTTRTLESIVDELLVGRKHLRILEAGCGSMSHFRYRKNAYLVGIDISQEQLDKNTMLNEKILADIQDGSLPTSSFDLIICWDVLEHLAKPELALKNFAGAAKQGGLILLASPNILTLRGLITKCTPHWIKVLYYRHIVGFKQAGTPGNYPFKSYHRFSIAPSAIKRFAGKNNLAVEACRYTKWDHPEHKYAWFTMIWNPLNKVINLLTLGKIGTDDCQGFQMLLRKQEAQGTMLG
jgi:2-polyprenyl-3-methyl-5-hydroxy-6-metoxy-1,4-benzoquinol methylase